MTSEIVQGKAAWARLKQGSKSWSDWVLVGYALQEGRAIAMRNAGTTSPSGRGYWDAFNEWLTLQQVRHRSVASGQAAGGDGPPARDRGLARDPEAVAAGAHEPSGRRAAQLSASDRGQAAPGARQPAGAGMRMRPSRRSMQAMHKLSSENS
jgi:hypothetical protein